ncbi:MAG: hypothetical protein R6V60_10175 [Desulfobacterales bacterium]
MNKFKHIWSNLRSSFWFIRSLIVVVSIAFAIALIKADSAGSHRWLTRWPRMLGAFQTLAGLIADPNRRRALLDQVQWVPEMADRSVESAHDRSRINAQIARVREALEADGCPGEEKNEYVKFDNRRR